jgi:hypothetical protein
VSLLLCAPSARADEEALRRQIAAQEELIRRQSEALEQVTDRVRALEDERAGSAASLAEAESPAPEPKASPHRAGSGFPLGRGDWGSISMRIHTYVRYLNQTALDETSTDSFGNTSELDLRQDVQVNKVVLYWFGWLIDPKLSYLLYVWSANTSQGLGGQTLAAGNIKYAFSEYFNLGVGISALPSTRSTTGNFPFWLGVDNRLITDEFMRGSYTSGVFADGTLAEGLTYQVMLGDNLSQLGIDAGQMDDTFDTFSFSLAWMPTTGEFGPGGGFGDYEGHEQLATRFGLHFTRGTETSQGAANSNSFDNVQVRLSDGNVIFKPGLFGPGIDIEKVLYQMMAVDAGFKWHGFELEGEYFHRWVSDLRGTNAALLGFDQIEDQGVQLQASAMLLPETLQAYVSGSKIFGRYGDPWDARIGVNWFPWHYKGIRWNNEMIYVQNSPVGALSLPYAVGGKGPIFLSTFEVFY